MNKRRIFISAVSIVLVLLMTASLLLVAVRAANSSTIKSRLNQLESEASSIATKKSNLESQISATRTKSLSTIEKKGQIDQQIEITRLEIRNTNEQIQEYNQLLAEKQTELDEGIAKQKTLNEEYQLRIRAMEEDGKISYWAILFNAKSFSDLLDRIDMISEISTADQLMLQAISENNKRIEEARAEIEADRLKLQDKASELDTLNQSLAAQNAENEKLILQLASDLETLSGTYEELDAEEDAIRAKILEQEKLYQQALTEEQKKKLSNANANNAAGGGSGGFISPVPAGSAVVTDAYGYRVHPIYGYYAMHSGVDLAAPLGTPVYAIAAGNVNISTYSNINGNYVSISHGNGYGSLYAHLDYAVVSAGSFVTQGQIIGYVGSTGWATGPHLHFEIHLNGSTVNPMNYISLN
ncbi:MAG: peptidoglycan DD-metalloendopeptidase family protein [Oscillospiraceae bacterium]|nr:peptidoglycan DD-metalloendopeptidase family protein [Oscillospiraceae bacterium]